MARRALLIATVVLVSMALASATAVAGPRRCGIIYSKGSTLKVKVLHGHVTCSKARWVLKTFFAGKGTLHGPPGGPAYLQTWSVGAWSCGYGAGGGVCIRGGATFNTAPKRIEALLV
jgi:hypothetical protein